MRYRSVAASVKIGTESISQALWFVGRMSVKNEGLAMKIFSNAIAAIACFGLLLPQSTFAQTASNAANHAKPPVRDLVLGQGGTLQGQVVDAQNAPRAGTAVIVLAGGKKVRETTTDNKGHFVVDGLRSGLYAVGSEGGFGVYRTWTSVTAPPSTPSAALIVESGEIVRGQSPLWYWLTNPWIVSLGIAALIVVPIAVNNNDKSSS
jgi:hypothetical protein